MGLNYLVYTILIIKLQQLLIEIWIGPETGLL